MPAKSLLNPYKVETNVLDLKETVLKVVLKIVPKTHSGTVVFSHTAITRHWEIWKQLQSFG